MPTPPLLFRPSSLPINLIKINRWTNHQCVRARCLWGRIKHLTLRTLLLGSNDLEVPTVERTLLLLLLLLLRLCVRVALLRDLTPPAARLILRGAGRVALVNDALGG